MKNNFLGMIAFVGSYLPLEAQESTHPKRPLHPNTHIIRLSELQTVQDSTTTYRVQFLSSSKIDKRHFKNSYVALGEGIVEVSKNGLFHYMIVPKTNSLQAAQDVLDVVKYDFPDAFIVYYHKGVRYN